MAKHEISIPLANRHMTEINPLFAGYEACDSLHAYGPAVRNYCLIHYVRRGKGIFRKDGVDYEVTEGQIFIINSGEVTYYIADRDEPWDYVWIAFDGTFSEKFRALPVPVCNVEGEIFSELLRIEDYGGAREEFAAAAIWRLYAEIFGRGSKKEVGEDFLRRAKNYISSAYMNDIKIDELARTFNFDRRYFSRRFKERYGTTPREYLGRVRLENAKELLKRGVGATEVCTMVGFGDFSNFAKAFRAAYKCSPTEWRQIVQKNQ